MKKLLILIAAISLTGCISVIVKGERGQDGKPGQPGTSADAVQHDYQVLKQDQYGGRDKQEYVVVTGQKELEALYGALGQGQVPVVDFSRQNVVALFMGQKSNGGYSIGIREISVDGETLTVVVEKKQPSGMATMALTAPYCIASVPKAAKTVFK